MKLGANFAVFVIFFGLALYEATVTGNWFYMGIFILLGLLSIYADNVNKKKLK